MTDQSIDKGLETLQLLRQMLPVELPRAVAVTRLAIPDPFLRARAIRHLLELEWDRKALTGETIADAIHMAGLHPVSVALVYPGDATELLNNPKPRVPVGNTGPVLLKRFQPFLDAQSMALSFEVPADLVEGMDWDDEVRVDDLRRLGRLLHGFDLVIPAEWENENLAYLDGLVAPGNFICGAPGATRLPDKMAVAGDIVLGDSGIEMIPSLWGHVFGSLDIQGVRIRELPPGLIVHGTLYAGYTEFPEVMGLQVQRDCDLAHSLVSALHQTAVQGDLFLDETPIRGLGQDVFVGGKIFLGGCREIPDRDAIAPMLREKVAQWPVHLHPDFHHMNLPKGFLRLS